MGFIDFEAFNQALLAKQAWQILQEPNSLCARVLKAKYFKDGDLMTASCPKGASYSWRSIIHGRDLLKAGLVCRIRNGHSVEILHEYWIPRKGCLKPLGARLVPGITRVCDLLSTDGTGWDRSKLERVFPPGEVQEIVLVALGGPDMEDFRTSNFTKKGHVFAWSAYHLRMSLNEIKADRPESSSTVQDHKGWLPLGYRCTEQGQGSYQKTHAERACCWIRATAQTN